MSVCTSVCVCVVCVSECVCVFSLRPSVYLFVLASLWLSVETDVLSSRVRVRVNLVQEGCLVGPLASLKLDTTQIN